MANEILKGAGNREKDLDNLPYLTFPGIVTQDYYRVGATHHVNPTFW